jgi:hypothetical protein
VVGNEREGERRDMEQIRAAQKLHRSELTLRAKAQTWLATGATEQLDNALWFVGHW